MHKKEKKDLFLQNYINSFGKVAVSCLASKVSKSTYHNWRNPKEKEYDKDFDDAITMADLSFCEAVEEEVWKKIKNGSDLWMFRYLRNHCPERWKRDHEDEEGNVTGTIKLDITRKII
jgi:hypothetical protein